MKSRKQKANPKKTIKTQLVFDFETEQFCDEFHHAIGADRVKFAPKLRIACVYDIHTNQYSYFEQKSADTLVTVLMNADEIVSFNGKNFDLLVLQRHHGLSQNDADAMNRKHIDLCEEVEREVGYPLKLDKLSRINLEERKHTNGREMSALDLADLRAACRSDVSQTYRLFQKLVEGSLIIPMNTFRSRAEVRSDRPLIHSHLPDPFPYEYIDLDCDDMSEGELAEYLAGTWGILDDGRFTYVDA